jgi:ribosome-binding protein aMBF1 (putative translation factor)
LLPIDPGASLLAEPGRDDRIGKTKEIAGGVDGSSGIPRRIHDARRQRGMSRYQLGQMANVASTVVRAIGRGDDVPTSQFHAVVAALGLTLELVET